MINEISSKQTDSLLFGSKSLHIETTKSASSVNADGSQSFASDTVSLHSKSISAYTYNGSLRIQEMADAGYEKLRNYVNDLLQKQGVNTQVAVGGNAIDLATITPDKAQELVGENGYFGVEQTSERIFQLAVSVAGGDTSRIDAIKEGIDQGFAEAKKAFGDWLPDISYATYDAVMTKLDNWVAEPKATA